MLRYMCYIYCIHELSFFLLPSCFDRISRLLCALPYFRVREVHVTISVPRF